MDRRNQDKAAPLRLASLVAYGAPGLPMAFLGTALVVLLPDFYGRELGLGLTATGLILAFARLCEIALGPPLGLLIDRLDTRFGRRRPWPVLGMLVTAGAAGMLLLPPSGAGASHLLLWSVALYAGMWLMQLPYLAWGAELSPHYDERTRIVAWREVFALVGTIAIAALPLLVRALPAEASRRPVAATMSVVFWLTVGLLPVAFAVLYAALGDGPQLATRRRSTASALRRILDNRPFRLFLGVAFAAAVADALHATLFLTYVDRALGGKAAAGGLLLVHLAAAALAIPGWTALSAYAGKHRAWSAAMVLYAGALIWVPLLEPGSVATFAMLCMLSGAAFGADLVLPPSMLADLLDVDTLRSGEQRGGSYFAIWASAGRLALALAPGLAFPLLAAVGLAPEEGPSDAEGREGALLALAGLFALAPAALKLVAAGLVWSYPVGRPVQASARRRIEARAAAVSATAAKGRVAARRSAPGGARP